MPINRDDYMKHWSLSRGASSRDPFTPPAGDAPPSPHRDKVVETSSSLRSFTLYGQWFDCVSMTLIALQMYDLIKLLKKPRVELESGGDVFFAVSKLRRVSHIKASA